MKTTIAAMIAITGLIISGAEAETALSQFFTCLSGVCLFSVGLWLIYTIHGGE